MSSETTQDSPSPAPRRRFHSVQVARAIAALLVVGYHLSEIFEYRYCEQRLLGVFSEFGFAGVDLFFVISGIIMTVTCYEQFGSLRAAVAFLLRRATRIYPLYWVVTGVLVAGMLLAPSLTRREGWDVASIVASLLLLPQPDYPILAPGWTLVYEMYFYVVFALFLLVPRRWFVPGLLLWGLLTVVVYRAYDDPSYETTTDIVQQLPIYGSPLTLEFIAGCGVGLVLLHGATRFAWVSLGLGIIWFAAGGPVTEAVLARSAEFGHARVLSFGVASVLILYGLVAAERSHKAFGQRSWLTGLGNASYSLYLTHMLVLHAGGVLWARLGVTHAGVQIGFTACLALLCIGFACLTYVSVERPLLRFCRKMTR